MDSRFLTVTEYETDYYPYTKLRQHAIILISYFNFEEVDQDAAIKAVLQRAINSAENKLLPFLRNLVEDDTEIPLTPVTSSTSLKQIVADIAYWYLFVFMDREGEKTELKSLIKENMKALKKEMLTLAIDSDGTVFIGTRMTAVSENSKGSYPNSLSPKVMSFYYPGSS